MIIPWVVFIRTPRLFAIGNDKARFAMTKNGGRGSGYAYAASA